MKEEIIFSELLPIFVDINSHTISENNEMLFKKHNDLQTAYNISVFKEIKKDVNKLNQMGFI